MSDHESDGSMPDDLCDWLADMEDDDESSHRPRPAFAVADTDEDQFVTRAYEHSVNEDAPWEAAAADSLKHNGFCILRRAVNPDLCAACATDGLGRLLRLLAMTRELQLAPRKDIFRFAEICSRTAGGLRYDMRLPLRIEGAGEHAKATVAMLSRADAGQPLGTERTEAQADTKAHTAAEVGVAATDTWAALHRAVDAVARPVVQQSGLLEGAAAYEQQAAGSQATGDSARVAGESAPGGAIVLDSAGCVTS
eukprot:1110333-Prymnesium_polylepis.2